MRQRTFQKPPLSGRQVIEPNDAVARGEQTVDHMTADKTRRASDENAQNNLCQELKMDQTDLSALLCDLARIFAHFDG